MVADPKQEMHALIDQLNDDDASRTLAHARRLLGSTYSSSAHVRTESPQRPHALPTLHRAAVIGSIEELHVALFAPEENVEAFDTTVRRWCKQPEGAGG